MGRFLLALRERRVPALVAGGFEAVAAFDMDANRHVIEDFFGSLVGGRT